ncbi:MAG: hypothetical protein JSR36_05365 [Proteobacteria bacterium]|nr:hypothetical protein [Pseudomonadota bacterium]
MVEIRGLQFATTQLNRPDAVGSLGHVDGKVAIVCRPELAPHRLMLTSFNEGAFELSSYHQQQVLLLGNDLMFEPDLSMPSQLGAPGLNSTGEAYYNGVSVYLRVRIAQAPNEWPVLDLINGHITTWPAGDLAHAFARWRLGVKHQGKVVWVLGVGTDVPPWEPE